MLDRLTIRAKLFSLSTLASVFALTLSGLCCWAIQAHTSTFERSNHYIKTLHHITSTYNTRQLIRSDLENILLLSPEANTTTQQKTHFTNLLSNHVIALKRSFEKTRQSLSFQHETPPQTPHELILPIKATQQALDNFLSETKKATATLNEAAHPTLLNNISIVIISLDKLDDEVNKLDSILMQNHNRFQQENQALLHISHPVLGITTCVFLGILLIFTQRCSQNILHRLSTVADQLQRIIHGDLRRSATNIQPDEIGHLQNVLQNLQNHLSQTLRTVFDTSRRVSQGAETFRSIMGEITETSSVQATSSEDIALSAQELTLNVTSILKQTEGSQGSISEASQICEHSLSAMNHALAEMNQIVSVVDCASKQVQELQSGSSKISAIAQVIKEIADQTSLLALNAAIEAARAGEQGRGFAVVADEVRKLSERTADSTIQITTMIEAIMEGIAEAVLTMQTGSEHVQKGVLVTQNAQEAMSDISNINQSMIQLFQHIHSTLSQQNASTSIMASSILSIASLAEKNKTVTQDAYISVDRLQELANDLKKTTDAFQLGC